MDKDINLVEILKNAPKGTELWSPLCGECSLHGVDMSSDVPICVEVKGDENNKGCMLRFAANGKYFNNLTSAECLLFPSKQNRDWSYLRDNGTLPEHEERLPQKKDLLDNVENKE